MYLEWFESHVWSGVIVKPFEGSRAEGLFSWKLMLQAGCFDSVIKPGLNWCDVGRVLIPIFTLITKCQIHVMHWNLTLRVILSSVVGELGFVCFTSSFAFCKIVFICFWFTIIMMAIKGFQFTSFHLELGCQIWGARLHSVPLVGFGKCEAGHTFGTFVCISITFAAFSANKNLPRGLL